jgi:hypothetical protein
MPQDASDLLDHLVGAREQRRGHFEAERLRRPEVDHLERAPPPSPGPARYLVARDHSLPALRHVHLLMNVLHRDQLVSARSLALKREQALLIGC